MDQTVSQDVRTDFLPNDLRRLAEQDVQLHRFLKGPQIELRIPARRIEIHQMSPGDLFRIEQCCRDEERH